ncbi:MAG: thermonuclease family protein [Myxococcota bacterium]
MTIGGVALAGMALIGLAACDGNNPANGGEDTAVEDASSATDTTTVADSTPLDTALPDVGVQNENKDLRNGITVRIGHIVDGDTFDVWVGTFAPRKYIIRMAGLSAPECLKDFVSDNWGGGDACTSDDELYGLASYQALLAMLTDKTVVLSCDVPSGDWCKTDVYGRYIAYVAVDGKDAATEMARGGNGFSYVEFASSKRGDICRAELEAKNAKRGLWALGDLNYIMAHMPNTSGWYLRDHDSKCKSAMN